MWPDQMMAAGVLRDQDYWRFLLCPAAKDPAGIRSRFQSGTGATGTQVRTNEFVFGQSYGYNAAGYDGRPNTGQTHPGYGLGSCYPFPPTQESEVRVPGDMLAIGDAFAGGLRSPYPSSEAEGTIGESWPFIARTDSHRGQFPLFAIAIIDGHKAKERHNSKANVVFCDGHVEALSFKTLFWETNDVALSRWNKDHQPHRD